MRTCQPPMPEPASVNGVGSSTRGNCPRLLASIFMAFSRLGVKGGDLRGRRHDGVSLPKDRPRASQVLSKAESREGRQELLQRNALLFGYPGEGRVCFRELDKKA